MKPILIIKTGGTFPEDVAHCGDFEDWTRQAMNLPAEAVQTVAVCHGELLPELATVAGAVITGSHAMVTEQTPWMQATAAWLRQAVNAGLPVLGICFGHQLLAAALGGEAGWNPLGREIGTAQIGLTEAGRNDPLFGQLPPTFPAQVTHRQSALRLPPGARLLAASPGDPHQAFAIGSAWGVQFHPEFAAGAIRRYIELLAEELRAEGSEPAALLARVTETPEATSLLARFAGRLGIER